MESLVGTGGWAYFQIPGMDSLQAYARAFNYVEVNATFYQLPPLEQVRSWRERAPDGFAFAVRCHRGITHAHGLDPSKRTLELWASMVEITEALDAEALHLLTPPSLPFGPEEVDHLATLLDSVPATCPVALEPRAHAQQPLPEDLRVLMEDRGLVHSVDLSKEEPQVDRPVLYTRLFGKGYHTVYRFSDEELASIRARAADGGYDKALFTFHGIRMYSDAGRFLHYVRSGSFPSAGAPGQGRLP